MNFLDAVAAAAKEPGTWYELPRDTCGVAVAFCVDVDAHIKWDGHVAMRPATYLADDWRRRETDAERVMRLEAELRESKQETAEYAKKLASVARELRELRAHLAAEGVP